MWVASTLMGWKWKIWLFVLIRWLGRRPIYDKYRPRLVKILIGMVNEMSPGFSSLICGQGYEALVEEALSRAVFQEADDVPKVGPTVSELINIVDLLHQAETNKENIRDVRVRQIVDFLALKKDEPHKPTKAR